MMTPVSRLPLISHATDDKHQSTFAAMHIALVCRWYPPHTGFGGVAMHVYYLARALVEKGHRVTIVASRWSPDVPPLEEVDGIRVHRLLIKHHSWMHRLPVVGRHMRSIVQARYSVRVMRALRGLEKSDPPNIVEFADIEAEGYAYLRQKKRRCPVVVRCHTPMFVLARYYQFEERPWSLQGIEAREKYCIAHADALTAPSRDMARTIARECSLPEERIAVIPNALDVEPFEQAVGQVKVRDTGDDVVVLHVGRLDRGKGIEVLANAIPLVLKEFASARFIFIGDDRADGQESTWRSRLEKKFRTDGVNERVMLLGSLGQQEMMAWYGRADIAVVPSLIYESFSYTCAQAAAAGLPVVASRIGGIPETIDDGVAGIIAEPGNVEELAKGLLELSRDKVKRLQMGVVGNEKARRKFDSRQVAQRMVALYERTVASRVGKGA